MHCFNSVYTSEINDLPNLLSPYHNSIFLITTHCLSLSSAGPSIEEEVYYESYTKKGVRAWAYCVNILAFSTRYALESTLACVSTYYRAHSAVIGLLCTRGANESRKAASLTADSGEERERSCAKVNGSAELYGAGDRNLDSRGNYTKARTPLKGNEEMAIAAQPAGLARGVLHLVQAFFKLECSFLFAQKTARRRNTRTTTYEARGVISITFMNNPLPAFASSNRTTNSERTVLRMKKALYPWL